MSQQSIPPDQQERRERQRFPVRLMLDVRFEEQKSQKAVSRDASETGICFFCDLPIPVGAKIEFSVHPPEGIAGRDVVFARGTGKVVRCDRRNHGHYMVAAKTSGYKF